MLNLLQSFSYIISLITLTALLITPSSCKTNNYLINCGSPTTTSADNKTWYTDEDSTFAPLTANKDATKVAHVTNEDPSYSGKPPCSGARIFHSPFTYSFPISPGPKIVRLYFYTSATYDNTSVDNFFLTLKADGGNGSFTLLGNYSAYLHQQFFKNSFPDPVIGKEFLVMATSSRLKLTFSPTLTGSLAFVNGIEIAAVPDNLYDYFNPQSSDETLSSNRRSNSYASGSSSSNIRVGNAQVRCNNCGKKTLIKIVRKGPNFGMKFYGCPMWPDTQCDFFKWVNEHTDVEEYQFKLLEKDTIICELEVEQNFRDEKIKKLQLKKAKLEEELKEMKKEVIEMRIELEKLKKTSAPSRIQAAQGLMHHRSDIDLALVAGT
uniref:GRF-type domain-containing protein n=1 Tax=Chenopodium quinoa TaxID=63459 RepID=A0A803LCA9_CHEQI